MRGPSRPSEPDEEAPPEAPLADRTRMEPPPVPPPNRRGAKSRLRVVEEESGAEGEPEAEPEPEERGGRGRKPVTTRPGPREAAETRIAQSDQVLAPPDPGDDAEATAAGPPISVEVIHGPDSGKRKRVRGGRMVVGRGDGCDLKLVDTAASRRHLELIVGMSGAVVRDLGSGNGTKVNGERIEDEAAIQHGDEIVLGTTVLKVVDELQELEERRRPKQPEAPPEVEPADEEAPAPAPRGRKPSKQLRVPGTEAVEIPESAGRMGKGGRKQNPMVLAGLAMGVVVVLGLLVLVLKPSHPAATDDGDAPAAHGKPGKGGKAGKGDVASEAIAKAKNALRENNYDAALAAADEALAADPDNVEAQEYRKRIGLEKDGAAKLSGGMALLAANQFADARKILGGIPPESTASDKAAAELKVLDTKEAEYVFGQATQKLEAGDVDGAVTDQARLAALAPERGEELGRQIAAKKSELEHQAALDAKRFRNKKEREREMKRQKAENAVRGELDAGYRKFKAGEFDRASSEFEHIAESTKNADAKKRAKELAKAVRIFNANYQQVQEHEAEKAYEVEIKPLDSTIVAYQQIDPTGPLLGKLKSMLARDLVIKGQSAAARHDFGLAAKAYRKALEVKPGLTDAKDGLNNLRSHAHETYLQAYEEEPRDAESARKLYTSVCDMVGPGDEDCVKAKKRMENLGNRN